VGERGLCYRCPVVVLDGFRQVGHHKILLNAMLKIAQCQGIDIELPLQVGAHCLFHLLDLLECKHLSQRYTNRTGVLTMTLRDWLGRRHQ